ncbi:unnamed protein product [Hymenolepis diminuta]|uniref:Uncharacterized protein n=1 Tax=Hymenolepis diminuta TaxID=6216 RepID=A0A564Z422_HYMDI|nr:unnamed protein product [Hymenolepis diminuta]
MKYEATFKTKSNATVIYVADGAINLLKLDWIDMFNVLKPKCKPPTCANKRDDEVIRNCV